MSAIKTTPAPVPAPVRQRRRRHTDNRRFSTPAVYFVALLLVGAMLAPVVYIILGGFRSNSQITIDPAGFPNPWVTEGYVAVLTGSTFWREVGQLAHRGGRHDARRGGRWA